MVRMLIHLRPFPTNSLSPRSLTIFSALSSSTQQHKLWSGLDGWRNNPVNDLRLWGPNGPLLSSSGSISAWFFDDFAHVADDESRHFMWCSQRLAELGFNYGDIPANNLLMRECEKSSNNVAARLAVVPLVQEARELDAGPRLVKRLMGFGDHRTSNIVATIAEEEIAHVVVGVDWFLSVCHNRAPCPTFKGTYNSCLPCF